MRPALVVLGASGDLTARDLLPALAELAAAGRLPAGMEVLGLARDDWTVDGFRRQAAAALERHAAGIPPVAREAVVERLSYRKADVTDAAALQAALAGRAGRDAGPASPIVAYLALPPRLFAPSIEALAARGLPGASRIVVEKPFGEDVASARALNALLHAAVPEEAVFRIDHFLGMQTVQNILGLRFANRVFEPVWNHHHVQRIDITWDETLALEGRAGYYDHAGALADMIQNHLLQLLCLVAMEPPASLSERDLRDRKLDVLRAVRRPDPETIAGDTVRARYGAGVVGGVEHPAYVDEPGVDPARQTETFAVLRLHLDNWRWAGTPFVLRTGKALAEDRHRIDVWFREVPHLAFGSPGRPAAPAPNRLSFGVDPDGLALQVDINGAGDPFDLESVELGCALAPQELSAYARLLLDVFEGDPVLSIRDDEAEESWRIVEPVVAGWKAGRAPLLEYPAGSTGPVVPDR